MATSNKKVKVVSQTNDKSGFLFLLILFLGLPLVMVTSLLDYTLLPRQMFIALWTIAAVLFYRKKLLNTSPLNLIILGFTLIIVLHLIPFLNGVVNSVESLAVLSKYLGILGFAWIFYILYRTSVFTVQSILKAFLLYAAITSLVPLFQIMASVASGDFWDDIYIIKGTLLRWGLCCAIPYRVSKRKNYRIIRD